MSLWQKQDTDTPRAATPAPQPSGPTPKVSTPPKSGGSSLVHIGPSIEIKGELCGSEDLTIDGKVEGKISLKGHNLTIGSNGHIHAEVRAKSVTVSGEVRGNITADDRIEIAPSGSVQGDLTAPRVALADGSSFKGAIDMGRKSQESRQPDGSSGRTSDMPMAAAATRKP